MRIDLRGETYSFHSSCGLEGEGMFFAAEKRSIFLQALQDSRALSHKLPSIAARILFNCQRAIILEKGRHSIELGRSIESP